MATLLLPSHDRPVRLEADVCARTGQPASGVVRLKGRAEPGWVGVLFFLNLLAWLFTRHHTLRAYEVTVPYDEALHRRWMVGQRWCRLALGLGLVLVMFAVVAVFTHGSTMVRIGGTGLALSLGGAALGWLNETRHGIGVSVHRERLHLTRVHPRFAESAVIV